MSYTLDDMVEVLSVFISYGIKFIIIGDTVVQLALKRKELTGDIDLFIIEPSIFLEEEMYKRIAEENKWDYSTTEAGTPRLVARINSREIVLELYENFMDIYIPDDIINDVKTLKIKDTKISMLNPEQYFVLKARQGVDLDRIAEYVKKLKKIDYKLIKKTIEKYPEEEQQLIKERLKSIGLKL